MLGWSGDVVLALRFLSSSSEDVDILDRRPESVSSLGSCSFEWKSMSLRRRRVAPILGVSPTNTGEDVTLEREVFSRGKLFAFGWIFDGFSSTGIGFALLIVKYICLQARRQCQYKVDCIWSPYKFSDYVIAIRNVVGLYCCEISRRSRRWCCMALGHFKTVLLFVFQITCWYGIFRNTVCFNMLSSKFE